MISFALVELVLFCERVLGVRVPDSHLTGDNLANMSSLARCIAELADRFAHPDRRRMPELPDQIAMAAGDYFMHGQDFRMRQAGLPGNACCAVIKLAPGFDSGLLRRRLAASPIMNWLSRVQTSRVLPAIFPLRWKLAKHPEPVFFEHAAGGGEAAKPWFLPEVVARRKLHAGRAPGAIFDLFPHADGGGHLFFRGTTRISTPAVSTCC